MTTIDRRRLLSGILFGATAAGLAFSPVAATAMPLDDSQLPGALDEWIEKTQAVVVRPAPRRRPRRQVWRCWWNRGRRVCGWRWV
jgi:hypothetical protein